MKHSRKASFTEARKKIRTSFLAGVLVIVPIAAAVLILRWLFFEIDGILQPVAKSLLGHQIPGLGFAIMIVLIFVTGIIATSVIGKRLVGVCGVSTGKGSAVQVSLHKHQADNDELYDSQ